MAPTRLDIRNIALDVQGGLFVADGRPVGRKAVGPAREILIRQPAVAAMPVVPGARLGNDRAEVSILRTTLHSGSAT